LFDNDDDGVKPRAVLFDYVDDVVNVELDADDKDRAVHWRQQKGQLLTLALTKS
jgi:hypothetical protein